MSQLYGGDFLLSFVRRVTRENIFYVQLKGLRISMAFNKKTHTYRVITAILLSQVRLKEHGAGAREDYESVVFFATH